MLSAEFRHRDLIQKIRRVRTPEGSRYFDAPIGTPITAALEMAAKVKNRGKPMPAAEHAAHRQGGAKSRRPPAVDDAMSVTPPKGPKGKPVKANGTREERLAQYHAAIDEAHKRGSSPDALIGVINAAGQDKALDMNDLEDLFARVKDPSAPAKTHPKAAIEEQKARDKEKFSQGAAEQAAINEGKKPPKPEPKTPVTYGHPTSTGSADGPMPGSEEADLARIADNAMGKAATDAAAELKRRGWVRDKKNGGWKKAGEPTATRPKPKSVAGTPDKTTPPKKTSDLKGLTADDFKGKSERAKFLRAVVGYHRDIEEAKGQKELSRLESEIKNGDLTDEAKTSLLHAIADKMEGKPATPKETAKPTPKADAPKPDAPKDAAPAEPDVPQGELGPVSDEHVARWEKGLAAAKTEEDFLRVQRGLTENENMTPEQVRRLESAMKKASARVEGKHDDDDTEHKPEPSWMPQDMEGEAAVAAHFAKGGSIADAPSVGLWNAVLADGGKRFEVKSNSKRGIAPNFWVTDKKTGEKWMFKRSHFDGIGHFDDSHENNGDYEEHLNEVIAADLWGGAGNRQHTIRLASSKEGEAPSYMAQRHWQQEMDPTGKLLDNEKVALELVEDGWKDDRGESTTFRLKKAIIAKIKKGSPDVPLKMMVHDYLINNGFDRHALNFMLNQKKDGSVEMVAVDHGLAFEGAKEGTQGALGMQLSMDEFIKHYRADQKPNEGRGGWGLTNVIMQMNDGDKAKVKKQLQEALKGFEKNDLDAMRERMAQHNLDGYQSDYVDEWLGEYAFRLDWLKNNLDHMVDVIAERGTD